MAAQGCVEEIVLRVNLSAFDGIDVLAAIDRGCSLTKILFATASNCSDDLDLHLALFANQSFEAAVEYLASSGFVQRGAAGGRRLTVTGVGCDMHREMIEDKLGLRIEFTEELGATLAGARWLLKWLPLDAVCHPNEAPDSATYAKIKTNPDAEGLTRQWDVEEAAAEAGDSPFPFLFGLFGSGGGFLRVPESGPWQGVCGVGLGGKPFLGYAKMLLGTSDYDEIMRLAGAGRRGRVDNEARDLLVTDEDTPYGRLPPSIPIFPFGKVVDQELTRDQCDPADIAHALVAAFAANLFNTMCTAAKLTSTSRVVLGGNLFRHPLMRQEVVKQQHYFAMHSLKIHFLVTGHTGAVGAMLSGREAAAEQQ